MPFDSDKQRRYLWSQKPEVAKQIAYKQDGGKADSWWNKRMAGVRQDRGYTDDLDQVRAYYAKYGSPAGPNTIYDLSAPRGEGGAYFNVPVGYTPQMRASIDEEAARIAHNQALKDKADKIGFKFNEGGDVPSMDNIKKVTQKDRYGNSVSYEFESDVKPIDQTAIIKEMMQNMGDVPEMSMQIPMMDHPGEPKGTDTVPAWLTPGEFVVNKEATEIYGDEIKAMNDHGREIQKANKGMEVPGYQDGGPIRQIPAGATAAWATGRGSGFARYVDKDGNRIDPGISIEDFYKNVWGPKYDPSYKADGGWITDALLDRLAQVESGGDNNAVSKAGAIGKYQWMPKSAKQAGYGVKPFNPLDEKAARAATAKYLKNMQKYHGFTPEETLRAYNWGPGNVIAHKKGKRKDIPAEALNYPGKILGFDKVEGVPAPKGVPLPIARPEGLGRGWLDPRFPHDPDPTDTPEVIDPTQDKSYDIITPTPRPKKQEEVSELPAWKKFLNDYILGEKTQYAYDGGQIPHFDTLASEYEKPELPSNVVPALTDVPKGHKMFGGNETFAGDVNQANPNLVDDLSGSDTGSVNIEDEGAGNVPWYSGLLGPKSKDMLNIPLEGEDKEFLDNQTAMNEKLAGPQIAEEENNMAEYIENEAMNSMEDALVQEEKNEIKKDDKKKGEIAGEISQNTAENEAKNTGEAQTGPDKNQPGKNATEEEVTNKGNSAGKGVIDAAKNSLVSAFGDLFDTKELGRMAILYAGSRLLGYSHGGSLQYAAKQYLTRVDTKNANHQKYVQELTKSGKYTTKSISDYNKSKDINDLIPVGVPINETGQFKTFFGPDGQKVRATQVKAGKSTYWVKPDGKKINASYTDDASMVPGTKEFATRIKTDSKQYTDMINDLRGQFGTTKTKDGVEYSTELAPSVAGNKVARWAVTNGVPADQMGQIVENAYHSAIQHSQATGEKVRDLTPFLNNQWVIAQTGDATLFTNEKGQTVKGPNVSKLFGSVKALAKETFGKDISTAQAIDGYRRKWNTLDPKEQKLWNDKAYGDEETGFMKFIENDLIKIRTGG